MNPNDKALAEAMGIELSSNSTSLPVVSTKPLVEAPIASNNQIHDDAEYARVNVFDVIEQGAKAIEMASELARESQHPRAFEVLGQLLKVQTENIDKLLKIQKDRKQLQDNSSAVQQSPSINNSNVVFVGTTDELVRMMRKNHSSPTVIEIEDDE